jgi:hypothetical protein
MGTASEFKLEKLVIGVLSSRTGGDGELVSALEERWGPTDLVSGAIPFEFSHYYDLEMGTPIRRFFVSFERLVDPAGLARIKLETNSMEDRFRDAGRRKVNLDPGLLCLSRFVLASTKESSHRLPLAWGIWAEVTLLFEKGSFRPVEWTYPDYRSPGYIAILNSIRALYKEQVKKG